MITCPECGEVAQDGSKFCDRCGQGLTAVADPAPPASKPGLLAVGTMLKGGFEITEVLPGTSIENRYRARRAADGKVEHLVSGDGDADKRCGEAAEGHAPESTPPASGGDAKGTTAKTAELKPP